MREYNLAKQGSEEEDYKRRRREAEYMTLILNTQYSEPISVEQLLGEEEESVEDKLTEAEARLAALQAAQRKV